MKNKCFECQYYESKKGEGWGWCHFNPPVLKQMGSDEWSPCFGFATVNKEDYCSKYEGRKT